MDIRKPLVKGFWTDRFDRGRVWVDLKYERLGDFCYNCGKLGHTDKSCDKEIKSFEQAERDGRFGPGMRVAPIRDWLSREINLEECCDGGENVGRSRSNTWESVDRDENKRQVGESSRKAGEKYCYR
ncbi:Zinc finger, CCHC-type [Corchorus olitorius]|uniref:Zinc finger, CCHC-type n=1 Tax=Corchorus olitorius TaxID=93759 RepID=A0A1R3K269_9ROSI|nr:Zinc finger, CCHC-type [Corchorus olitorius]